MKKLLALATIFAVTLLGSVHAQSFVHPGGLNTEADFARIKAKVDAQESPWYESYLTLCNDNQTSLGHGWNAVTQIVRGSGGGNFALSQRDALCIYLMAVRWRLSGDTRYAEKAIEGMDRWSSTMTQGVTGDNWGLASGLCGYLFAVAGETLRGYPNWSQTSIDNYKAFLMRFYPQVNDWLYVNHGGFDARHARSNWDIDNMAAMAAIGVFCDDRTIFNKAIDYFKFGPGNGQVQKWCWYLFPEGIGQQEESTRDQAHACDAVASMAMLCQIAECQGLDLYGYDNNRFLRAAEYYSKFNSWNTVSNAWNTVPWTAYYNGAPWPGGFYETNIGWAQQGAFLPVWDMLNTHFIKKGMYAPYTAALAASRRPTGNIGNWNSPDYFGYDTLTHYQETPTTDLPPSSLWVNFDSRKVTLSWWGAPRASGYTVKRATVSGGPYTILGTTNASTVNFVDDQVPRNGQTYYYVVSATTPSGETANSAEAIGGCVTRYNFEGNASDSVGSLGGTLAVAGGSGLPGFATGQNGGQALQLNGIDQYVSLPLGTMTSHDITIATWIKWGGGNAWQRIFDTSDPNHDRNMFLTVSDGSRMRFYISDLWHDYDATLYGPVPALNTWTHVAITIKGNTATLYQNGVPVDTKWVGIQPMFGQTYTYIGKSMYNDPYFSGFIDDFRIYNNALSGAEIAALGNTGSLHAPQFASDPFAGDSASEGVAYAKSIFAKASDVDGGGLTFSKLSGPGWLNVAPNGVLTGTPGQGDVGVNAFNIRVTDASGLTDDATLYITVDNVNQAPAWNSQTLTKPAISQNEPYSNAGASLAGDATDADIPYGDSLTFSKASGPAWLSVASTGALSGTPGASDTGVNTFTVKVTDASGLSADATLSITVIPYSLRSQYPFENSLADGIGGFNGVASGAPAYVSGRFAKAISLNGSTDFVTLPAGVANYKEITVATWVYWNGGNIWQRVFDFGNDTSHWMFLAPSGTNGVHFGINNGNGEQAINSGANLPTGRWTHVAATLSGNTATLYINGAVAGTNTGMTLSPRDFSPTRNFIGDSQFPNDPCLNGMVDDFRIYNYALSASEIGTLVGGVPPATPTSFTAAGGNGSSRIALSWNSAAGATSYNVKRATALNGTYTTIYSGGATNFSDTTVAPGVTYYYIVTAVDAGGESVASNPIAQFANGTTPRAHLRLDETSGTAASDSSGNNWTGSLNGGATWMPGKINNSVNLSGTGNYANLPAGVMAGVSDFTISAWLKLNTSANWARLFDFGSGTNSYLFLTPKNAANGFLRYEIVNGGTVQQINTTYTFPVGVWTHVAVTQSGSTGTLYINGASVGTNAALTLNPSSLGVTTQNYIGKSQWTADPYLNGQVDEFQIYGRALSSAELADLANPLAAPTVSIAAGDAQATLTWNAVANATGYNVKRASASGGPYTVVGANVSGTTFTDTSLINSAGYFYVVTALNGVAESANSSEVTTTPVGAPPVPAGLQATGSNATVSLSWTPSYGATSYNILRSTTSGSGYALIGTSASASYADSGLPSGTTYYYVVAAVGPNGQSANSSEASAITAAAAPTGLSATGGNGIVTLSWNATAQAAGYNIKRSTTSGSNYSVIGTSSTPGFVDTGLLNGTTYYYVVSAVNAAGQGPDSAQVGVAPVAPPPAPSAYITTGNGRVSLAWSGVSGAGSYSVKRSASSGGPYTVIYTGSATSFVDLTAANGSTYYYVITATNAGGEGSASTVQAATPSSVPLKAYLRFDENSTGTALDSTGNNWNGAMNGGATWAAGKINGCVNLNGSGNYVGLPAGVMAGASDFTICAWVKVNAASNNTRIFDIGTGTSTYMELCPKNSNNGFLRYEIVAGGTVQQINTTYTFPVGVWTHVAMTQTGSTGTLYINGASVGTNAALTLNPSSLGITTQNYIGKSQWAADPYLNGQVDEFQIYGRALSGSELSSLANPLAVPASLTATADTSQVALNWSSVPGAATYALKRSYVSGGPYVTLATLSGTTYIDSTPVIGSPYFYVVTSVNGMVESGNSPEATATIYPLQPPVITSSSSASGTTDSAFSYTITASNDPTSYGATGLPPGLSVDTGTGVIGGTPTASGTSSVTISATNAAGTGSATLELTILPPAPEISSSLSANGQVGSAFSYTIAASNNPTSYGAMDLPAGLSVNTSTGVISGTPSASGTSNVTISATNTGGTGSATLTIAVQPSPPATPTGLTVTPLANGQVGLSWNASDGASGYTIRRSASSGGPYTVIASGVTGTSYTDTTTLPGWAYYYTVSAGNSSGESQSSASSTTTASEVALSWLKFDETSGATASDATSNTNTGTLVNAPAWTGGRIGNAVVLNGTNQYASLPNGITTNLHDFTVSAWVYWNGSNNWQRIFDFGGGTSTYMFLSPKNGVNGNLRFAITTSGASGEQKIDGNAALASGGWHHVAVTLSGATGTLYVDGQQVGQNTGMTLRPSDLGATTQNWIGRSQYNDPYFNGRVDDFRVYAGALSASSVAALAAPMQTTGLAATGGSQQVALTWSSTSGATSYTVRRSATSGGAYTTVASEVAGTSYTNTGLTEGTTYYYVVTPVNTAAGDGANSAEVAAVTIPAAPGNLVVTGSNGQASLTWAGSSGATGYSVLRTTSPTGSYTTVASGLTGTSYLDTGLNNGTTYYYAVVATNGSGSSANSSQVNAITAPTAPTGLVATAGNSQVSLAWNSSTGAATYNVLRSTTNGSGYATVTSGLSSTSYLDTGLTNGTTYYYVVTATNTGGTSANSSQASAIPVGVPSPWVTADLGTTGLAGSAEFANNAYTVKGAGLFGGTTDGFRYVYQPLSADGSIIARISTLGDTGNSTRVGIMMRDTLANNARMAALSVTGSGSYKWERRTTTGGNVSNTNGSSGTAPNIWVRLVRVGNTITASRSTNGTTWTTIGSATVTMASSCYVGLSVSSGSTTTLNTSVFDNVTVTP